MSMHEQIESERVVCALCGAETFSSREPPYAVTESEGLCFECAVSRGGVYDDQQRTWTALPSLTGLHWSEPSPRAFAHAFPRVEPQCAAGAGQR